MARVCRPSWNSVWLRPVRTVFQAQNIPLFFSHVEVESQNMFEEPDGLLDLLTPSSCPTYVFLVFFFFFFLLCRMGNR